MINSADQWYRVAVEKIRHGLGMEYLQTYMNTLSATYPNQLWQPKKFSATNKKAVQQHLVACLKFIFPDYVIEEEARIAPATSGNFLSVDVFIPEIQVAIEYQGEQHYYDCIPFTVNSVATSERDALKLQYCALSGICLVPIPYWWKGDVGTLAATIKNAKPEIAISVPTGAKPLNAQSEILKEPYPKRMMNPEQFLA